MSNTNLEFFRMSLSDLNDIKYNLLDDFDDFWTASTFENELNSSNSYYIVAKQNNEIVGFIGMKIVLDEADIMNVVTQKKKRNLGIATQLMNELLKVAHEKNIKKLTLEVNESNLPAIHLYKKFGFKTIATREKYYKNTYDAYIMQINI